MVFLANILNKDIVLMKETNKIEIKKIKRQREREKKNYFTV